MPEGTEDIKGADVVGVTGKEVSRYSTVAVVQRVGQAEFRKASWKR